jgi:hypothetical protein
MEDLLTLRTVVLAALLLTVILIACFAALRERS